MLKLSIKCTRFESNYSSCTIYVAVVDALRKNESQDENSVYHQNWWKN
jgi:hypothetical protein